MNTYYPKKFFKQQGLTLVELMVAITLGLLLISVVLTVFLSSTRNYAQDDRFARMQENGRFAMRLLIQNLSLADFWGGMSVPSNITAGGADCGVDFNGNDPIVILSQTTPTAANLKFDCIDASTFKSGTDVLLVKRVLGSPATAFEPSKVYLQTDTNTGIILQSSTTPTNFAPQTSITTAPTYWEFTPHIYYVQNNSTIPTLYQKALAAGEMRDEPLIDGIENFHIQFGIDTDANGVANQYIANPTSAQMAAAINARIHILARSVDKDREYSDKKTYWLGDVCYNVGGTGGCGALTDASAPSEPEKYHRRVFTSTVTLRNPANLSHLAP